jgi:hypothetical protein
MVGLEEYSAHVRMQPSWGSHQEMPCGRRESSALGVRPHPGGASPQPSFDVGRWLGVGRVSMGLT